MAQSATASTRQLGSIQKLNALPDTKPFLLSLTQDTLFHQLSCRKNAITARNYIKHVKTQTHLHMLVYVYMYTFLFALTTRDTSSQSSAKAYQVTGKYYIAWK